MNQDSLAGEGRNLGGQLKETAGRVTGDNQLQGEGLADQLTGQLQKGVGAVKDVIANPSPTIDKAKQFARARPYATAALAGVVGLALLNTLRGR